MVSAHRLAICFALALALLTGAVQAESAGWQQYKSRFMMPEGRIIDTGNHNVSHTEGQGFAMLLAVYNDDRAAFDSLLNWTNKTLYRNDVGLYAWRYDPTGKPPVTDKNNASDGDTLIAWALLLAGDKWQQPSYTKASEKLQTAIAKNNVFSFAGYTVMLPGMYGFNRNSYLTLNPSYFMFPAWKAFYQHSHLKVWKDLDTDARKLLSQMRFGAPKLPTDWVRLLADGTLSPSDGWPSRFSFDAVRIPLYLNWGNSNPPELGPYVAYWRQYDRLSTPAWVDVLTGAKPDYTLPPGLLAIRDATLSDKAQITDTLAPNEDYYSSSLHLLAYWSVR